MALRDFQSGASIAVGVLPAAIVGVAAKRRARLVLLAVGFVVGVPMAIGSLVASTPVLAIAVVFVTALAGAALARQEMAKRQMVGRLILILGVPLVGIGLSYDDLTEGLAVAGLMVTGSVIACAASMLFPERSTGSDRRPPGPVPPRYYGFLLGAAGASAAAIGYALDLDHVGWACGAALLVMRPDHDEQALRMVGRVVSVFLGASAAALLVDATDTPAVYSVAIIAALAGVAGTRGSRWYVTPGFTTFLVIMMLSAGSSEEAGYRFTERVTETLVGVAVAFVWGIAVPAGLRYRRQHGAATE